MATPQPSDLSANLYSCQGLLSLASGPRQIILTEASHHGHKDGCKELLLMQHFTWATVAVAALGLSMAAHVSATAIKPLDFSTLTQTTPGFGPDSDSLDPCPELSSDCNW